ncbi:TetR/AcrR family transcriptional regulator [Paludibacterium yongneupense]|uniref:TetR/AcrR family transcriptional regulator n=1 Tax=Paludibacterium yongneupense TaxID=400061 RepID=UPI001B7FCD49|nr:TetR/AcrR family transcriptional regulator [Paludibacterium yongneupense]
MPVQSRSRATFEAIIHAATYILTESGWESLTTNAIAERAGVNIGSLYQYFPNKEAVIAELQRRHVETVQTELSKALTGLPQQPSLRAAIGQLIEMIIREHRVAPALHRAIEDELPRAARSVQTENDGMRQRFLAELKPLMKNVPDPEMSITLLSVAIHALIHHAAAERPEWLEQPRLKDELVVMVENYLSRPAIPAQEPPGRDQENRLAR